MREIKFRGKRTHNGDWIYGYYYFDSKLNLDFIWNELDNYSVMPDSVGQFTGLLDKNGNEIYEGDILKTPCSQIVYTKKPNVHGLGAKTETIKTDGVVVCEWESYGFKFSHIIKNKHGISIPDIEIIGNIYEHKNLIK